jgi:hypothetical protein
LSLFCLFFSLFLSLCNQGDILEEVHDVELNNNASFYRAILAVHKENYG